VSRISSLVSVRRVALLGPALLLLCGCGGDASGSPPPPLPLSTPTPPATVRDHLTVEDLFEGRFPSVLHNGYFQPVGDAQAASDALCGTLRFAETRMSTTHPDSSWMGSGQTLFPSFALAVARDGDWLVPLQRGLILSGAGPGAAGGSFWNVIVSPGRVWQETTDAGFSRAMLAFTLTDNFIGQARNGLASFVFDAAEVSPVAIQITQETAPSDEYQRLDFHAVVPVVFDPECPSGASSAVAAFAQERADRLPLRPWSDLPDAESSRRTAQNGFADTDLSAVALLLDGQLYLQPVATRSGPHPRPEWMRHGVFSVTKTLGLGLSMFHLAQRYGDGIFEERVTDYVPALAAHPGWQGVSFHHVLNMVTGTAGSDEGNDIAPFIRARRAEDKIGEISRLPDAAPAPGTQFRYASTHSFVLSYALQRYVQARQGPGADYWSLVEQGVLEPIGIPHLPLARSIEPGGRPGVPVMGWGSYPDVDAAAKVAQLLQDEGAFRGRQLLSRSKVREALRRAGVPAYETSNRNERYLHSVWTVGMDTGRCTIEVPLMSGHGGNHVMMMPSGLSVVRFMDATDYEIRHAALAAETYRSSCR
jgi:CubicO group peptidase (beta-lactamase class C family)